MTEKDLKKLNRQELLEVLLAQSKKIDRLQRQLNEANEKLNERELRISEAGSIAEASLVLNNIFADAQKAADQYLENIRLMHDRAKEAYNECSSVSGEKTVDEAVDDGAELTEMTEECPAESAETVEIIEDCSADEMRLSEEARSDRLAAAEAKAAAEADRESAEEYLAEIRQMREQTESECAEMKKRTDRQIRVSLIRTKKAIGQMITLYADEVTRRMNRLKEWDRQMEALHERNIKKQSSKSQ